MSSSDEIDNPAAVESSGSEFEEEDVTQEPRKMFVLGIFKAATHARFAVFFSMFSLCFPANSFHNEFK